MRSLQLGLVASALALGAAAADYTIEVDGRSSPVAAVALGRDEYLDLAEVAAAFRFEVDELGRKEAELRRPEGTLRVRAGRAVVLVNDQPLILSAEVRLEKGSLLVPLDFVTRAVSRLLGVEARSDPATRTLRFGARTPVVTCETFADRMRVTLTAARAPEYSEIVKDGRRRVLTITNQELPAQVGGCLFDDTLEDLEIAPREGRTRVTFFVGSRFASLKVYELPEERKLVFDFFNDSAEEAPPPAEAGVSGRTPRDVFDTVVLDAGHGGSDRGAVSAGGLQEKDLALAIALETAKLLREAGLEVVLTRSGDETVALTERTALANRAQADLFLSIHANATRAAGAVGAETYFLSAEATDEAARTSAALENDATGLRSRGGEVPGNLEILLWDMAQQQYLAESSQLAETVQRELNALAGTFDRGVKQANFLVLRGATMPAVLVEVGFLSTPAEERKMRGEEFRTRTAQALARAVVAFRDQRLARQGP